MDGKFNRRPVRYVQHGLAEEYARREVGGRIDRHVLGVRRQADGLTAGVHRHQAVSVALAAQHPRHRARQQPKCRLGDCVEHRLHIRRRAADDLEDVGRGRLPLQRLFCFVELPHVLDGNHGLVGEGLEQLDLRVAERDRFEPCDVDGADRRVAPQHRDRQDGAVADRAGSLRIVRVLRAALGVCDRDHATLPDDLGRDALAPGR